MKKLITIIFVLLTSCASYTLDGIDMHRYSVDVVSEKSFLTMLQALISPPVINDSIPPKRILIKYYPVYVQRHSPYYNHYYSPQWSTPYYIPPRYRYNPSYSTPSNRGSIRARPTPNMPGQSSGSKSPNNSGGKSKGGVIQ